MKKTEHRLRTQEEFIKVHEDDFRRVKVNGVTFFVHRLRESYQDSKSKLKYTVSFLKPYNLDYLYRFITEEGYSEAGLMAYQRMKDSYFSGDNLIVKELIYEK